MGYASSETYFQPDIEGIVKDSILDKKLSTAGGNEVPNIEGIKKLSQTEVEVKCRGFEAPAVYSICGIDITPLHYYGDESQYDYKNNKFGFPRGDLSIIEAKTTVPMGAGHLISLLNMRTKLFIWKQTNIITKVHQKLNIYN